MAPVRVEDPSGTIDADAFNQILELDDDDTHAYSKDMISMYFAQVPDAFASMDAALSTADLATLTDRAHFIVGSSATLGIARVAEACARMESVGEAARKTGIETADTDEGALEETQVLTDMDVPTALAQIRVLLAETRRAYAVAEAWLRRWYAEHGQGFEEHETQVKDVSTSKSKSEPKSESADNVAPSIQTRVTDETDETAPAALKSPSLGSPTPTPTPKP